MKCRLHKHHYCFPEYSYGFIYIYLSLIQTFTFQKIACASKKKVIKQTKLYLKNVIIALIRWHFLIRLWKWITWQTRITLKCMILKILFDKSFFIKGDCGVPVTTIEAVISRRVRASPPNKDEPTGCTHLKISPFLCLICRENFYVFSIAIFTP